MDIAECVAILFDNPDFAGVSFQHWYVRGDERVQNGEVCYAPRTVGRPFVESVLQRAKDRPMEFTVVPLFTRPFLYE